MIYNKIGDYKMLKIKVQETKPKKPSVFKLREQLVENQTYGATVVKVEVIPPHEAFSSLNKRRQHPEYSFVLYEDGKIIP